jgi:hypothetical protein
MLGYGGCLGARVDDGCPNRCYGRMKEFISMRKIIKREGEGHTNVEHWHSRWKGIIPRRVSYPLVAMVDVIDRRLCRIVEILSGLDQGTLAT